MQNRRLCMKSFPHRDYSCVEKTSTEVNRTHLHVVIGKLVPFSFHQSHRFIPSCPSFHVSVLFFVFLRSLPHVFPFPSFLHLLSVSHHPQFPHSMCCICLESPSNGFSGEFPKLLSYARLGQTADLRQCTFGSPWRKYSQR